MPTAAIIISQDINVDDIFNPVFISVATGGTVGASSTDPVTGATPWVARTMPSSAAWNSVCFGDKVAVAVAGSTANMGTTGDGVNWYTNVLTASKVWQSVCYGNGYFVVVANGAVDTNRSTDGTLFTAGGNQRDAAAWYSVCYGVPNVLGTPTPMFVCVATTGAVVASNSTDNGATWNRTTIAAGNWQSVCFGTPTISGTVTPRFVAVSYGGTAVAYSDNGTDWSASTLPNARNWSHVIYANGVYVTCAYGTNVAAYSTNGVNWTEVTLPSTANWNCIAYGVTSNQGLAVFSIIPKSNAGLVTAVSYDGINWFSAVGLNAAYNYQCYCPFPWNSGDTLTVQNNATITVNTNQNKFWKTITGTFGTLKISNDSSLIGGGKYFQMGRITAATVNAILPQSGLFSIDIDGTWIYLDNGTGVANQALTIPFTEYLPTIEVETYAGSGIYEVWCNVSGAIGPYNEILGKDGLEWVGSGHRGNYFVQTPVANPIAVPVLTNGAVTIGSYYITFDSNTSILPGANIVGTGIPTACVVNRVISATKVELSTPCTATNTGLTLYVYNPFRSQFQAQITVGDGVNGNVIPNGSHVRCANLMISDSSPANIASTGHTTDASIDMSLAGKLNAKICLFGDFYLNCTQAAEATFEHVGFAYSGSIFVETYVLDIDYMGIAASPTYWYYTTKWICRDQRWGILPPPGYTAPTGGVQLVWSYLHNASISNFHMVLYSPAQFLTAQTLLALSFTNDSVWTNIRISVLWNTKVNYGIYFSDSCFRNQITNLQMYGITPLNLNYSSDNIFNGIEYSLSMNSTIQSFKSVMRIADDPATGLPLVDNTKYYFRSRSFRSWMDRTQYYDSNEYSATAFQGGWQFPDYLSIRPTETIARSVTFDWIRRDPTPTYVSHEIYRSETPGFTERSPANRVWGLTGNTPITAIQGVKVRTLSNVAVVILTFTTATHIINRSGSAAGSWITDGFVVGDTVYVAGSFKGNDGAKTITALTATDMTVTEALYTEVTLASQILEVSRITTKSSATVPFAIAAARTITRSTGWIATEGLNSGDVVDITGSRNIINNGTFCAGTVSATVLTMNEPMVIETTPTSTSSATRIMTWDSGTKTIVLSGAAASTWVADGWYVGDIFYVSGSLVNNYGPYTISTLTNSNKTITTLEAFTSETGNAAPVLIVYRKIQIAVRAPTPGTRYYYRFRKYNFNSIAALGCSNDGYIQSVTRVVTLTTTFTLTTTLGHGFIVGQSVVISGFSDTAYNGTFTIWTVPSLTTFTIALAHANDSGGDATSGKIIAAPTTTTNRAVTNNVATLTTAAAHRLLVNQAVVITGLNDATYRGTFHIASVPTATTFTYALTHADEVTTADTTGLVENTSLFSGIRTVSRQITIASFVSSAGMNLTINRAAKTMVVSSSDWATLGFVIWDTVTISGSNVGNNGTYTIQTIATVTATVVESPVSDEVGNGVHILTGTGQPLALVTTPQVHGFVFGQTITVSNMQNAAYNGTFQVRSMPATTTLRYVVSSVAEGATADNSGLVTNTNMDFDNIYYLAGFQFEDDSYYVTNLVNNLFNSMFAPGVVISGRGIQAGTKVVSINESGREMIIDKTTTTSTATLFATTYSTIRRSASSTAATFVTSTAHTLEVGDKIKLVSTSDSSYNGTYVITAVPSNTRITFAHGHAAEVEVVDVTGVITLVDMCLTIPAQAGMSVFAIPGTSPGIQAGTSIVSVESSSMLTLSQKPTWATQYANVSISTFTESPELTCVPNYYAQNMNYCLQSRAMGTTWGVTNTSVSATDTYIPPTTVDWTTKTMDQVTASAGGGYISQTIANLLENTQYTFSIAIRADQTQAIPNGVAGTVSLGATDTAFTATNKIQIFSATVTTGAGVTSLVAKVTITTNGQIVHIGDAMLTTGATAKSHIPTTTVGAALFPQATPLAQLRSYCRPQVFTGRVGNQGIEVNFGTAAVGEIFTELHISPNAGFTPSASTLAACTFAAETAHFYLVGQSCRNEFLNILKVGGGAASAALSIFYLNTTSTDNVFMNADIDQQYCNNATVPIIYIIASSHNNLFHNIDFGRVKNYVAAGLYYQAAALNAITGTKLQNIRYDNYDVPVSNETLNALIKGVAGGLSVPITSATTWALGSTTDGLQGIAANAVYGSQFYDMYTSDTEGALCAVMEDTMVGTKPYVIKAGTPKFTNTARLEMVNGNSTATVHRARSNNVATIGTLNPHHALLGDEIVVSGLGGTGYNGTVVVTQVVNTTHFTYANIGGDEVETSDTAGSVTVGDSIEWIWPYKILGVSGFRKLFPKLLQVDSGTQTDFPEGIRIEVSISANNITWSAYVEATPSNLNALSVSPTAGFYFKFKLTVQLFMKYGTLTNPIFIGDTIKGAVSRQTAIVTANDNYGLTGTLTLKNISGLFLPGELLVDGTGATKATTYRSVTTNVATITTFTAHGMNTGFWVTISGMTDTTYNGNYIVSGVPTATTFTYALTHANEGSTADAGGTVIMSANRATNVATNGFAVGPSLTSYLSMIQFFTTYVNQSTLYPSRIYPLTITVLDPSFTPLEGVRIRVTATSTAGGYTIGDVILSGTTNSSGVITTSIETTANVPVSIRSRKSSTAPYYKSMDVPGTFIYKAGLATTLVMVLDQ